jgi:hypothetical protein
MTTSFAALLDEFTAAVVAGDGQKFAGLFAEDGEYDDVFYGLFKGREAIANMLEGLFHRDGENFIWQMIEPMTDGKTGYARWLFSFDCKLPHIPGKRIYMDGVGLFNLRDGLISRYEDLARTAELFRQMELPAEKHDRVIARMFDHQMADPRWSAHRPA